jgi:hypothetical protein
MGSSLVRTSTLMMALLLSAETSMEFYQTACIYFQNIVMLPAVLNTYLNFKAVKTLAKLRRLHVLEYLHLELLSSGKSDKIMLSMIH